jgi:hypothetical protein
VSCSEFSSRFTPACRRLRTKNRLTRARPPGKTAFPARPASTAAPAPVLDPHRWRTHSEEKGVGADLDRLTKVLR